MRKAKLNMLCSGRRKIHLWVNLIQSYIKFELTRDRLRSLVRLFDFVRSISFVRFRSFDFVRSISFVRFRSFDFVRLISFVRFRSFDFVRCARAAICYSHLFRAVSSIDGSSDRPGTRFGRGRGRSRG